MDRTKSLQGGHPPYMPKTASVGEVPTIGVDVPICAIFLVLFVVGAASNMTILKLNQRKGHKFLLSGLLYGFCMARVISCIFRIVWACHPNSIRISLVATIFVSAGVQILFIVNLVFVQRVLRATHPRFGWHNGLSIFFKVLYVLMIFMVAMVVVATVQSFHTLNSNTLRIDRDLQLGGITYFLSMAFAPVPMVLLGLTVRRRTRIEKFGFGRWRPKFLILLVTATMLTLGASFRVGTAFKNPRPKEDPAWYHAKWCFYFFNYTIEIGVIYLYVLFRVDLRFHVPNGSHGPGDYSRRASGPPTEKASDEARNIGSVARIMSMVEEEEDVFVSIDEPVLKVKTNLGLGGIHTRPLDRRSLVKVEVIVEVTGVGGRKSWSREVWGDLAAAADRRSWALG